MTNPSPPANEVATCRGCERELDGLPYYRGGRAYTYPVGDRRRREAKSCHYGGFVCSEQCDRNACLSLEMSMPGHMGQTRLLPETARIIRQKWPETNR